MFGFIGQILGVVAKPVTDSVKSWQARKSAKLESDLKVNEAVTKAKIERISTSQHADIAWENLSIQNSGWKDEWFTIVLSIPAVLCFCGPTAAGWVRDGFAALAGCPQWYQWAFSIAIASSFGYRKIADFMALKKGA